MSAPRPYDPDDPSDLGRDPEALIARLDLPAERKRALLERWRRDLGDAADPERKNLLERIGNALASLDTETGEPDRAHPTTLYTAAGDAGGPPRHEPGGPRHR